MAYDLHAPTTGRRISRLGICIAAVVFAAGAFALPASAAVGSPARPPVTSSSAGDPNSQPDGQCKPGYVYRDSFEGDGVCVTPEERDAAHTQNPNRQPGSNECKPGYVYRDSFEGDGVCVTPEERDAAHAQNPNRQPGSNECKPGYVYRDSFEGDGVCVTP
ncbi:hypothetical protein, partial [Streptomyces sp. NPDC059979]|uniref:hypothetical protein n=1 Tax=Streptomyces sp. NPDC059979 TaxID=3347021 RepID=UPI0036BD6E97